MSKTVKNIRDGVNNGDTSGNLSIGTRVLRAPLNLTENGGKAHAFTEEFGIQERASKVQDEIMKLLLDAGWEIGFAKKNGKSEEDVAFFNLKGKTYWSIISAYKVLKLHYESRTGKGKFYSANFQFVPISEDDFTMLSEASSNRKRKGTDKSTGKSKKGKKVIDGQHTETRIAQNILGYYHLVDISADPNDDLCLICGDSGDLLCCESCPSSFHLECLKMDELPSGDWHCNFCLCKICGLLCGSSQGAGIPNDHTAYVSLTCCFCEHKYHKSCLKDNDYSLDASFCGNKCRELFQKLEGLLGVKHEIGNGLSWTIISRSDNDVDSDSPHVLECNSKLEVAFSIVENCFKPHYDPRTGVNIMESILYNCGSNFNRLNYRRFVTAILEKGDEIICVASLRVHGNNVAEMPYITTSRWHRRQGKCRKFLTAIETELSSLGVEFLLIPSIAEHVETWCSAFGFQPLDLETKEAIENMNLVVFPNTIMLHRKIQNNHDSPVGQHGYDLVSLIDPNPWMSMHELGEPSNVNHNEAMFSGSTSSPLANNEALDHEVGVTSLRTEGEFHNFDLNIPCHDEEDPLNANDEAPGSDLPPVDGSIMNIEEHGNDDDNKKIDEEDPSSNTNDEAPGSDLPPVDGSIMNIEEHGNDDDNMKIDEEDPSSNTNDEAPGSDLPPVDGSIMNIEEHGNDDDNENIDEEDPESVADAAVNYTLDYLRNSDRKT